MGFLLMKTWSLLEKAIVRQILWTYEDRYKHYKERGWNWSQTKPITAAIRSKKKTLALLEKREIAVVKLAKKIEEFAGVRIFKKSASNQLKFALAKSLFYKAGLEEGHISSSLAWYTGCTPKHPERQRRAFQRSFTTNSANKKAWADFKNWSKLNDNDSNKMESNDTRLSNLDPGKQAKEN